MTRIVPTLSFKHYTSGSPNERKLFIKELFVGLKEYGFIVLKDHSLGQELIDLSYKENINFFNLDKGIKSKYSHSMGGQRGYTQFGQEHAKDSKFPDLKEFWHTGRDEFTSDTYRNIYPQNKWPKQEVPGLESCLKDVFIKLEEISFILLEAIGESLDVDKSFFKEMITDGNSILRSIHYPETKNIDTTNKVRAAAHEDINLITLLVGATATGLELKDKDGSWLTVENGPGEIIVDTGDMMSRLTNNILPSTTHRVINPDDEGCARFSMPFFVHPHSKAMLKCLPSCIGDGAKYSDITSGDYLNQRLKEIGLL